MKVGINGAQVIAQNLTNLANQAGSLSTAGANKAPSFTDRLQEGLNQVAKTQNEATQLAKNFEFGTENDLSKVMVSQQVSSVAFQLTLNVRNKELTAYKDIMNMPV